MDKYDAEIFITHYNKNKIWKTLWKYLNTKESIIRMQTASDLDRPAIEGVIEEIENNFGEYFPDIKKNRGEYDKIKQMIGHMIKKVMLKNNYSWIEYNVRVKNYNYYYTEGKKFNRASRYTNMNKLYD